MSISTRGRYAVRMMVDIAQEGVEHPVSLRSIAERQDISYKYLEQIAMPLVKGGLIHSIRGAHGGYALSKPASLISIYEILSITEGDMTPVSCVQDDGASCQRSSECRTLEFWKGYDKVIREYSSGVTLAQLAGTEGY